MAYTRHDWECGETISAELLNNLEDGVEEALACCEGGGDSALTLQEIFEADLEQTAIFNEEGVGIFPTFEMATSTEQLSLSPALIDIKSNSAETKIFSSGDLELLGNARSKWQDALGIGYTPFSAVLGATPFMAQKPNGQSAMIGTYPIYFDLNEGDWITVALCNPTSAGNGTIASAQLQADQTVEWMEGVTAASLTVGSIPVHIVKVEDDFLEKSKVWYQGNTALSSMNGAKVVMLSGGNSSLSAVNFIYVYKGKFIE